jgi:hypothetical protein
MALWNQQTTHTDISQFSDNPELRRELKIWRLKIAASILAVLAVIGFSARPAYRAYRDHRMQQNLEVAKNAARLEEWGEARDRARSVLLVRPDLDAYRIWTRALGKLGEPNTYMAVSELFTHSRATREDLLEALQVMAQQAPQALTLSAYASLPIAFRDQPEFRAAMTPLLLQRGQIGIAEKSLREVAQAGGEPSVRLELLRVLCCRPDRWRTPECVAEARAIFAELLAAKADKESLAALVILGNVPGGLASGTPLPDLPSWLEHQPKATAQHHLLGMDPSFGKQPTTDHEIYQAAINRFLASDPALLGDWLIQHGKAELAASLLEPAAKTRADAYLTRLKALLRLKKSADLTTALITPPASCDVVEIEMMRAQLAYLNDNALAADAAWTRALNSAVFDINRNRFIDIAHAAEALGAKDVAENAWVAAICSGWGLMPLYGDLLPVFASLISKSRADDVLAMFRMLLRFEPMNPELQNNAYYFGLILGILPPNQVVAAQEKLIERLDKPVYHSTLMLAQMLDAHPVAAIACLPKFKGNKAVSPSMVAALEGTARVLAGETEAGTALLKDVNWISFMRQERIVFRDLLMKLKISELPMPDMTLAAPEPNPDQIPAWRKAVERLEKDRASGVLPSLPNLKTPGADRRPDKPSKTP